jgi:hypothetical protein
VRGHDAGGYWAAALTPPLLKLPLLFLLAVHLQLVGQPSSASLSDQALWDIIDDVISEDKLTHKGDWKTTVRAC